MRIAKINTLLMSDYHLQLIETKTIKSDSSEVQFHFSKTKPEIW